MHPSCWILSHGRKIVVRVPSMFVRHQVCQERFWLVTQALYGLSISPRSCAVHRDVTLSGATFPMAYSTDEGEKQEDAESGEG